jgi:hypothetical protein
MRAPHFVTLVRVDGERSIAACRHGIIHLNWGRTTVRMGREEFRRLVDLLARALSSPHPSSIRDGDMIARFRPDDECELRLRNRPQQRGSSRSGSLAFLVPSSEFLELHQATQKAIGRLDKVLASGMWEQDEEEEVPPANPFEQLGRSSFSDN